MVARAPMLLLLVPLLAGGCSFTRSPGLSVADVTVAQQTQDGVVLIFTLDATNENRTPLPLRGIQYSLSLDGKHVFTGTRSPEGTLSRLSVQQIRLPAVVPVMPGQPLPAGVSRYELSGTLAYTTPDDLADILFDTKIFRPTVGFSKSGSLDFSDLQPDLGPGLDAPIPESAGEANTE